MARNADDLVRLIKKIAMEAVESSSPADVYYGEVISATPLKIQVDLKLVLESAHLDLTRNVTDFDVEITVGGSRQTVTMHNALIVGDKVMILRAQGGKKYVVIDRV